MQLVNATSMAAGYTQGLLVGGREVVVVAVKGTFLLEHAAPEPRLAPKQAPLTLADTFEGEPGLSATIAESDYAPHKPACDVLFRGSAYAPPGKPAESVTVRLQVGRVDKSFVVFGDRTWQQAVTGIEPSAPKPFVRQPFSYATAYGGVDRPSEDPARHKTYLRNPVGVGYHPVSPAELILGKPVPNTHALGSPVRTPHGDHDPMALGPIGRGWKPRYEFAGTYDQKWIDNVFPFLPADFDDRYFQCAPPDQQVPHPAGGEEVTLTSLTPATRTVFRLPRIDLPITFKRRGEDDVETRSVIDTVIIEPDDGRFQVVWRSSFPLKRNMKEMEQAIIGRMTPAWYRARATGKTYYPSLAALAQANAARATQDAEVDA